MYNNKFYIQFFIDNLNIINLGVINWCALCKKLSLFNF